TVRLPLRFQTTGTHEVELIVDTSNEIREVTESNNSQKLLVQISQTALSNRLIARPNPFTPNNDGYNDQIEFDYSGLGLSNPSLQIFDANGIPVWSSHNGSGGQFIWNGRDDRGREVLPGVYLYSVRDQGNNVASGYVVVAR
ncbi:gliding motility-associated C-terminal domain-containing protein, partial [bacterium]|nr:gliding motility-associated C-terminal domain-containing protein [bacterium]